MNRLTFGMITGMAAGALYSVVKYVIAPTSGGVTAKDALGNDVRVS